ncbi:MAG: DNA topoisomerase IB, partial [Sulfitobacter sp.]|nr:DNA topoisomerase IB [Sulfitobacter sp.]
LEPFTFRSALKQMAIPPAYEDVWMSPLVNGHLLATGRDTKARKQYRYHDKWAQAQSETKFNRLIDFGHALPKLRRTVLRDLEAEAGERLFALASAVTLIDRAALRVGNSEYTRENGSYGAVTLQNKHVNLSGNMIRLRYTAKGGKKVRRQINDRTLAKTLGKINDLPGAELFSWVDEGGEAQVLNSTALNKYIADAAGSDEITAKTFRTWAGTVAAFEIAEKGHASIKAMAEAASEQLSNTPTVARNSHIHPSVIDLAGAEPLTIKKVRKSGLFAAEARLLSFLETV